MALLLVRLKNVRIAKIAKLSLFQSFLTKSIILSSALWPYNLICQPDIETRLFFFHLAIFGQRPWGTNDLWFYIGPFCFSVSPFSIPLLEAISGLKSALIGLKLAFPGLNQPSQASNLPIQASNQPYQAPQRSNQPRRSLISSLRSIINSLGYEISL